MVSNHSFLPFSRIQSFIWIEEVNLNFFLQYSSSWKVLMLTCLYLLFNSILFHFGDVTSVCKLFSISRSGIAHNKYQKRLHLFIQAKSEKWCEKSTTGTYSWNIWTSKSFYNGFTMLKAIFENSRMYERADLPVFQFYKRNLAYVIQIVIHEQTYAIISKLIAPWIMFIFLAESLQVL